MMQKNCWICLNKISIFTIILALQLLHANVFSQEKILRFKHFTVDDGLPQNTIQGIVKDKYGFIWLGTWEGLCKFDGYKFIVYKAEKNNVKTIYNNRINYLYKDSKGEIWVCGADTTISKYNYETDDFTRFRHSQLPQWLIDSLDRTITTSYTSTQTKEYSWVVYQQNNILSRKLQLHEINNLLTQTNIQTGKKIIYRADPLNHWALADEYVYHMYLDDQEILWVGTYSGGINYADLRQKSFNYYYSKYNDQNSLIDNLIRAFCEDKEGNLWVGTHNKGITKINRTKETYKHYQANKNNPESSITQNMIRKIYCDRFGYVWIGTKGGANKFDPKTGTFKHYMFPLVPQMPNSWVYDFMEDHKGNLWIGTWTGIGKYDRKKDYFYIYNVYETLPKHSVRVIIEDKKNNLWVATEGGLSKLHRTSTTEFIEKLTPTFYKHIPENPNSLSNDRIYSMLLDDDGIFWLGTASGLNRFDPEKQKFMHFGFEEGIPDEFIVGILDDKKGNLWISHKKGLTRFNKKTHAIRNFAKHDGLQSNDFSEDAYYRNPKTGEMFFGGNRGFNSFFPDSIKDNPYFPVIQFTNLKINNISVGINTKINDRIVLVKPIYMTNSIELTQADKVFSIEFSALHYSSPNKNKYAYKLEGFDKEWIYTDASRREAVYSNLPAGNYVFKVMASNCDGLWAPTEKTMKIKVLPAWWGTLWFNILVVIFILSVLYLVNYFRERNYLKTQTLLTSEVEQRTKELKEANELLMEKQVFIQRQADTLIETNKQLVILNSTKDRLFSIIAHDLRNPFHTVSGFTEVLLRNFRNFPPEKIEKYLHLINISSINGNNLLDNLLQWSRAQTGRISFDPVRINLYTLVEENIALIEGDAKRKNIEVKSNLDDKFEITADENMLKTIVRNLLSNAIKFTSNGGNVTISARQSNLATEITVADSGVGINSENLSKLFKIDHNYTTKGTSNESGTGLGLLICKEFVEKHGGKIWAESEEGKGSKFKFTIIQN
jgi:signal transduction histidine kinase/ligand-binding sensor domain-containing protein